MHDLRPIIVVYVDNVPSFPRGSQQDNFFRSLYVCMSSAQNVARVYPMYGMSFSIVSIRWLSILHPDYALSTGRILAADH